ncbi:MAG: ATP-binding protein [Candidatus Eisenbacteria bacterium]|uniref:ATP-binding protein n=1 Tax=Eiseniibacteriota bacterium TaxID=2212470 RepID=A0A7Y2EB61_UNCEI|nr:ATP-binding protein [Candidatus Eisenbacteria bacterium]
MAPIKIALIGTHGVGKTTLCFDLASRLKRLDYALDLVKEVARDCPLPINRETTYEAQAWILHTQIARELAAASHHEIVLCDRSVLDNYAYLVHRMGRRPELEPLVASWLKGYKLLVKVPIWQPLKFDGVRDVAEAFQLGVDETIDKLIESFDVRALHLQAKDHELWPDQILEALGLPSRPEQQNLFGNPENTES